MKERLNVVKEYLAKINRRTKIIAAIAAAIIVVGAIVITLILNHKDYVVLFSDVTEEETTQILAKLQEMNVEYKSDGSGRWRILPGRSWRRKATRRADLHMMYLPRTRAA